MSVPDISSTETKTEKKTNSMESPANPEDKNSSSTYYSAATNADTQAKPTAEDL